ncbi:MAG: sugar ABC transporter permease [Clostridiaceae bacterium]|nr:sugar ABC transporter permease [Clostridiaceae bacterium]
MIPRSDLLGKPRRRKRIKPLSYLLILPAIILFGMFTYYPFIKTIVLSFALTNKSGNFTKWVGFDNWVRVLSKSSFWQVIVVTLKIAGINLIFTFGIAMIFALLATEKVRWSKLYQTMYALPMAIASSPAAAIFLFIYRQSNGLLNNLLGTTINWTNEMPYAMWSVCAMTIWMHVGVSFIFLLVGFRNVPEDVLESAWVEGAGPLRRIKDIIIPIASPQIFFVLFLNINSSFKAFAQIKLLTGGGPANQTKNLIYFIYENAIINGRFETACVQALFLFGMIFFLTRIQFIMEKKVVHYQ